MMKWFLPVILLLFFISTSAQASDDYYVTFEGRVSLTGSEPFIKILIHAEDDNYYTLSGPLVEELRDLSRFRVLVTGPVSTPIYPGTEGDMSVEKYTIKSPYHHEEKRWILGYLRRSRDQLVMVGNDQVIYRITNPEVLGTFKHEDRKALLIGSLEFTSKYSALFLVESFKILGLER